MKKLLSVLLLLCLCLSCAAAETENVTVHSCYPIIDCEKSLANEAYADFCNAGELSIVIPGCPQTFVPQGLAYYAPQNLMLFSGYDSEKKLSTALIAVDMETNAIVKEVFLNNADGSRYTGHAGGVCVTDKNIFISDGNRLHRLPLNDFMAAKLSDVCTFAETISVPCRASYCQINNGILWVGEFYYSKDEQYHTDKSHHAMRKDGPYRAWLVGYQLVNDTENELNPASITAEGAVPDYILSTTDRIQGATFCADKIFLSQSYGRTNNSTIYRYSNVLTTDPAMEVQVLGASRPLWFLDSGAREAKLECPPMTEGLCTIGDNVYISFESGATKYRAPEKKGEKTSRDPLDRVYKLDPLGF